MVEAECGDAGDDGPGNNVCRVVSPAYPNLENGALDFQAEKDVVGQNGEVAEIDGPKGRHLWLGSRFVLLQPVPHLPKVLGKQGLRDGHPV